ncbi:hypothetical protein QQ054_15040 [Oscillatoria amoena NRMC-F 0135]|nr:hypothetical protein [Oscillatoria amoena NRMC-F 0135]
MAKRELTIRDISRVITMVPYRCCRLVNTVEGFTANWELQAEMVKKAAKDYGFTFQVDNHSTWAVRLTTGEYLAMRFSDSNVYFGSQIEFCDW